jgi:uncharacterized protein (TIGR03382 family)
MTFDTCNFFGSTKACDVATGVCGGIPPVPDAGVDAGMPVIDAGTEVDLPAVSETLGAQVAGCGCSSIDVVPFGAMLLLGWSRLGRRSRRR